MITHPEKILFPEDGITKGELAEYYEAVAPLLLPHVEGRPVTMERYPQGIDQPGFIQKDVSRGSPEWLKRAEVPKRGGTVHHALIEDVRSLLWVTNQNCITPHAGIARLPELHRPDRCVFDLDPAREEPEVLRRAALAVRATLEELGLACWVKTSGSKGFHVVVPLDGSADFETVWRFAHGVAAVLVRRDPEHLTQEFIKSDREGPFLLDPGRNGFAATIACAYAVRPKPGAPVSAPCTWEELEQGKVEPRSFGLRTMRRRIAEVAEPWSELLRSAQPLARAAAELEGWLTDEEWAEARAAATRKPAARKGRRPKAG